MKRFTWVHGFCLAIALGAGATVARGQASNSALRDRVGQLIERLSSPEEGTRKSAEEALIKLGPRVLPLLPEDARVPSEDGKARLAKIRQALREAAEDVNLGATMITLKAKGMRLSEVMQKLQAESGNAITDLREAEGAEATNPSLDVDIEDKPFLEALDIVCALAEVTPTYYSGDGSIGLLGGKPVPSAYVVYNGPFRVAMRQIGSVRDFQTGMSTANAQFDVAWEPRLRPMLLKLDAESLKVTDDRGESVEAQVEEEMTDVVLRPENPVAEVNLSLKAPDRAAKKLATLKVKAEFSVPSGLRTFRFPKLDVKEPSTIKQGDVAVTLEGTEVDEQVWKLNVELSYPGEGPAFESYRQGLFNNRLWLQKRDGSRFEHNGGFSNTAAEGGKLGFEYLFVDAPGKPGDYSFVYETPSDVKTIPLEFEFKDVPLP